MAKKKKGLIEQLKALIGLEKEPELMGANRCHVLRNPHALVGSLEVRPVRHGKGVRPINRRSI